MMRRAEREGASSSISSGSGSVEMGMRPSRITGARAAFTFDFLLHKYENRVGVKAIDRLTILLSKTMH